jgi:hypothetical protein
MVNNLAQKTVWDAVGKIGGLIKCIFITLFLVVGGEQKQHWYQNLLYSSYSVCIMKLKGFVKCAVETTVLSKAIDYKASETRYLNIQFH